MNNGVDKKICGFFILVFFMISLASAGVTVEDQPNNLYNLGDKAEFTIKVTPEGAFNEFLTLKLVCGTLGTEVYKEYISTEEEITKKITIPLVKSFIGESKGACTINSVILGKDQVISNQFTISNLIKFNIKSPTNQLSPGDVLIINGTALRENGLEANGFVEVKLESKSGGLTVSSEIISGSFSFEFILPQGFEAGDHLLQLYGYELNKDRIVTNAGTGIDTIVVRQVPTNIEVVLDEKEVMPGESLKAKILLHDQSGEEIDSFAYVAIKNEAGDIVQKMEQETDVFFEFPINSTQAPSTWTIGAYSEEIINKAEFKILEKREVDFELVNQSLIIKNVGNVPFNDTINVTVGNKIIPVDVLLSVSEESKYVLSAPNGEYDVRVGEMTKRVALTGNAIDVKKFTGEGFGFNLTIVWVFVIFVLGFVCYIIFRKGYKRSFFGRVLKRHPNSVKQVESVQKHSKSELITPKTKVELSLSIAGTKQNAVVGCLTLKNYESIKSGEGNVHETLENIVNMIEFAKGLIYKNHGHLFFIFAPVMTKTFKNEAVALDVSNKILAALKEHNKKFKQKIEFGLGVNYGTIVTKIEVHDIKFMTMGTLMAVLKKMASSSSESIYVSEKIKERLATEIKAEARDFGSVKVYEFKEFSKKKDHSPFIKGFVERQQKERLAKENLQKKIEVKPVLKEDTDQMIDIDE